MIEAIRTLYHPQERLNGKGLLVIAPGSDGIEFSVCVDNMMLDARIKFSELKHHIPKYLLGNVMLDYLN